MRLKRVLATGGKLCALGLFALLSVCPSWSAPKYAVLHAFGKLGDGAQLNTSVVLDSKDRVYGNTTWGGYGYGTVFKLTRQPDGQWKEKKLYEFRKNDPNGTYPYGGVILDSTGNLYGVASYGTNHGGTVYELMPGPSGWTLTLLYSFCSLPDCSDGSGPQASLVFDSGGNLYGASNVVFQLSPDPNGWVEKVLYVFCSEPNCTDGSLSRASLILDAKGNLYGTTDGGGAYRYGAVFKLRPMPDGSWRERVLHSFGSYPKDGVFPGHGALAFDSTGNLYGTTNRGGANYRGTIFRLTRQPNGHWKETILHSFKEGKAGYAPGAGVVIDAAGNLYGTAGLGGSECDCGVVYKMAPNPDGTWTYTVLHRLTGLDGAFPEANLVLDNQGNLYGTTRFGGPNDGGVVFEITP
jgi:uncharacterized repeat protein (TIGR03803 family)